MTFPDRKPKTALVNPSLTIDMCSLIVENLLGKIPKTTITIN